MSVTLALVGDIHAAQPSLDAAQRDAAYLEPACSILRRADARFANLESPLLDRGAPLFSSGVRLQSPAAAVTLLQQMALDVVSLANNHMMDHGIAGLRSTLDVLQRSGIRSVGAGDSRDRAAGAIILPIRGQRIGFLAACDDEGGGAVGDRPGVNVLRSTPLVAAVRDLRSRADIVVTSIHTGIEFSPYPEPYFVRLAHQLVDAGATVVVGHHPHVPQGLQRRGHGLIAYSLGDFLFDLPRRPGDMTARQGQFNVLHPILEVKLEAGAVRDFGMHWLTRQADGRYTTAQGHSSLHIEEEFRGLCQVLEDNPEYERHIRAVYRAELKDMLYYFPLGYCRRLRRGGSRPLKAFLWWLGTWRRAPKRRRLLAGLADCLRHGPGGAWRRMFELSGLRQEKQAS
jgi:poly-gamma-glutamate synthesis protein (capsule biosynthesis protein)